MIKKLNRRLGERGQIIIMVGLATIVMFGIVGLAVDVGRLYVTRVELGRSLDVAALSGILELNGQSSGLTNAEDKAEQYFQENEGVSSCDGSEGITCTVLTDPSVNELTMDGTKTIKLIFLSVLGIKTASVSAHAKAGFGTQYLDAVLVLDATPSMNGSPIANAKAAAITFKNILLGSSPSGNVLVGVTPFRGCFNPPRSSESDCITNSQWSALSFNSSALNSKINNITASSGGGSSATNVCTGLSKGWEIISTGNHDDDVLYPGNRQYLILLSDGDNAYWGSISYQNDGSSTWVGTHAPYSPTGTSVGGTDYPCMPYQSCGSPWGGESQTADYPCEQDTINQSGRVGELSDVDGSSPQTCVDKATPRERQMDARTIHLARAIKAQGIEIFVVAFAGGTPGCNLNDSKIYDDSNPSDCNSVVDSPAGPIGNNDDDNDNNNPANTRLLKCIASSGPGSNDHYFYANDSDELNGIFTAIANQIAHRLIE